MISLRRCNMKLIFGLVMFWLFSGVVAAGLIWEVRPATMTDVALGPVSLVRVVTA